MSDITYNGVNCNIKVIGISGFKGSGKDTVAKIIKSELTGISCIPYNLKFLIGDGEDPVSYKFKEKLDITSEFIIVHTHSMAQGIRNIVSSAFNVDQQDYMDKEKPIRNWTKRLIKSSKGEEVTYRYLLNSVGETFKKLYGKNFWVWNIVDDINSYLTIMTNTIKNDENIDSKKKYTFVFVIPDIRYRNEISMLHRFRESKLKADVEHWLVLRESALPEWAKLGLRVSVPMEYDIIKTDFNPSVHEFEWVEANPKFNHVLTNNGTFGSLAVQIREGLTKNMFK